MAETYKILGQELAENINVDEVQVVTYFDNTNLYKYAINDQWFEGTFPANSQYKSIVYGQNKFLTVGSSTNALYSFDGVTWDSVTLPVDLDKLVYDGSYFAGIRTGSNSALFAKSTDGITWSSNSMPLAQWAGFASGGGRYVATTYVTSVASSTDGVTWTSSSFPADHSWADTPTYGNGVFVVVSRNSANAAYSTDGITWSLSTLPSSGFWSALSFGNGRFVAIDANGTTSAYSTDGITWSSGGSMSSAATGTYSFFDGANHVALGFDIISYSTDGTVWQENTVDFAFSPISGAFANVSTNVSKTIYTVPSNTEASISSVSIINNGSVAGDYYLGVVKSADSSTAGISNTQTIIPNKTLAAGTIDEIVGGITLSAGDEIRIYSESPDLTAHVYGVELS